MTRRRLGPGEVVPCAWCGVLLGADGSRPLVTVTQRGAECCNDACAAQEDTVQAADDDARGEYEAELGQEMGDDEC